MGRLVGKKQRLVGKEARLGSRPERPIEVTMKIACPVCGRTQIVDLQDWQTSRSWWLFGELWIKGGAPYTCVNDHPSVEMVPARDLEKKGV